MARILYRDRTDKAFSIRSLANDSYPCRACFRRKIFHFRPPETVKIIENVHDVNTYILVEILTLITAIQYLLAVPRISLSRFMFFVWGRRVVYDGVCECDWKVAEDNYLGFGGKMRECNTIVREKKAKEAKIKSQDSVRLG